MKRSWMLLMLGTVFVFPSVVHADRWRTYNHHNNWYRHEPYVALPGGGISLRVGGFSFYYREGLYYRQCPSGYVIVPAPVGACVPVLPPSCQTVVMNGVSYYNYDGAYYQAAPNGYTVVPIGVAKSIPVKAQHIQEEQPATYTENVPNKNGSFTPVNLQLASNGMFIGPQGEVYPTKPTMEQLIAMYGK